MQLQHLRIESIEVFAELFCPVGLKLPIEVHWPYLETLQLKDRVWPFGGVATYVTGLIRDRRPLHEPWPRRTGDAVLEECCPHTFFP